MMPPLEQILHQLLVFNLVNDVYWNVHTFTHTTINSITVVVIHVTLGIF